MRAWRAYPLPCKNSVRKWKKKQNSCRKVEKKSIGSRFFHFRTTFGPFFFTFRGRFFNFRPKVGFPGRNFGPKLGFDGRPPIHKKMRFRTTFFEIATKRYGKTTISSFFLVPRHPEKCEFLWLFDYGNRRKVVLRPTFDRNFGPDRKFCVFGSLFSTFWVRSKKVVPGPFFSTSRVDHFFGGQNSKFRP